MRTQGWWLNVAKRPNRLRGGTGAYTHYCSIWLGDNRVGEEEKQKAAAIKTAFQTPEDILYETWNFTLTEEWISGKEHPL